MRTPIVPILALAALLAAPVAAARDYQMDVFLHDGPLHIAPDAMNAAVGDTFTLNVQNAGTIPHNLVVCGNADCSVKWGFTPLMEAGQSAPLAFTAKSSGTFEYYCDVPGHKAGGMRGQLTVQGEAPAEEKAAPGVALIGTLMALAAVATLRRRVAP